MDKEIKVLIAEDSEADAELIARELGKGDFANTIKWVKSGGEFLDALQAFVPDIILCDYNMPGYGAPEALEIVKERLPATPFIVISGTIGEDIAVEMLKSGATDYVMKNNLPKLALAIKRALKDAQAKVDFKRMEREVARAKEIQFRTLIESLPGKVFLKDRNSGYISCNENYAKDLGIKPEEVGGKTDYNFFPTHLAEKYRADDKHVMGSGETKNAEEEYATIKDYLGNSQTSFINTVKVPIRDDAGNVTGVLGFFWDITERKRAEEFLRESENRYRNIFVSSRDAVMTIEPPSWEFTSGNPATIEMFKMKDEAEFMACDPWQLSPELQPDGRPSGEKAKEMIEAAIREGSNFFEWMHKRASGEVFPAEVLLSKIEQGGKVFLHAVVRDITERKRMEEEKIRNDAQAIAAKAKTRFAAIVSHELRSPLTIIQEAVSLVLDGVIGNVSDEQKDYLDMAKRSTERLGRLINNVLDFQKIDAGKMEFDIRGNDLNEVAAEVHKHMSVLTKKKGLDLGVELEKALPQIRFDRDKLFQVFMNLVSNAIANTEAGSVTLSIQKENHVVHVRVRDTGAGISAEDLPRLFQPFEQVACGRGKQKGGTGLGLAITKEIILAHHGKIWAESELGRGSTFHFVLPIQERRG